MDLKARLKLIIIIALLIAIYFPTFVWMKERFLEADTYYSHGFLIPLVFLYLIWARRRELKETEISPSNAGLSLIIPALLAHLLAYLLEINFICGFSFIAAILGLLLYLYGFGFTRRLFFPVLFLVFMVPLPQVMIISVSFKMKLFAAQAASFFIKLFGIPSSTSGSIVYLPNTSLTIGDPCSGLRSSISLTALGALYAYLAKISRVRRVILFLVSVPLALIANIMRIILLLLVAFIYGSEVATGRFHDFSGFLLFAFALAGLIIAGRILSWEKEKPIS